MNKIMYETTITVIATLSGLILAVTSIIRMLATKDDMQIVRRICQHGRDLGASLLALIGVGFMVYGLIGIGVLWFAAGCCVMCGQYLCAPQPPTRLDNFGMTFGIVTFAVLLVLYLDWRVERMTVN